LSGQRHAIERSGAEESEQDDHYQRGTEPPQNALPEVPPEHCSERQSILQKRPPFYLRHGPRRKQRCPKTQRAIKQEVCGKPPVVLLLVEGYCQNPEEKLAETEK
jgi:hypothetical protein